MSLEDGIKTLILRPHNGNPDAPVECIIQDARLSENPQYEAISYVWGEQKNLTDVYISGQRKEVTQSLKAALLRFRLAHRDRVLWIDQLCINQDDLVEKGKQVQRMWQIYSKTTRCLVWLGEIPAFLPPEHAVAAVDLLHHLAAVYKAGDRSRVLLPASLQGKSQVNAAVNALRYFTKPGNAWWSRLWTLQEAVLPPWVDMVWGPFSIPWHIFAQAKYQLINKHISWILGPLDDEEPIDQLVPHVAWVDNARRQPDEPFNAVFLWRWRGATDKRDKIYGLLGLIKRGSLPITELCDYEIPAAEVFTVATLEMIAFEKTLLPLVGCPRVEEENATPDIPSWALDLAKAPKWHTHWMPVHCWRKGIYNACGGNKLNADAVRSLARRRSKILELDGWFADTVEFVAVGTTTLVEPDDHGRENPAIRETVRQWKLIAEDIYNGERGGLDELFGRLLIGDWLRDSEQRPLRPAKEDDWRDALLFSKGRERNLDVRRTIRRVVPNQVFFITKKGFMGIGHLDTLPGDEVWVLEGGLYPFILRSLAKPQQKSFIGACYVQGLMKGELFADQRDVERQKVFIC